MAGKGLQIASILLSTALVESSLVVTTSTGFRVKTDGLITTLSDDAIPSERENNIYLPRVIVRSIHNSAVKQGACF